jgi:hypothetical protein
MARAVCAFFPYSRIGPRDRAYTSDSAQGLSCGGVVCRYAFTSSTTTKSSYTTSLFIVITPRAASMWNGVEAVDKARSLRPEIGSRQGAESGASGYIDRPVSFLIE